MIRDHDRSGWFGASDTATIMGNWNTATFGRWWLVKLGLRTDSFTNLQMQTGTAFEHRILDHLGIVRRDRQIKLRPLRLRVNLDGETRDAVHEVKTYGGERFKVTKAYWQQAQVEMFATGKRCVIEAYRLEPEDYYNWLRDIDPARLSQHPVEYDIDWICGQYLPRLKYLADCLKRGRFPDENPL